MRCVLSYVEVYGVAGCSSRVIPGGAHGIIIILYNRKSDEMERVCARRRRLRVARDRVSAGRCSASCVSWCVVGQKRSLLQ